MSACGPVVVQFGRRRRENAILNEVLRCPRDKSDFVAISRRGRAKLSRLVISAAEAYDRPTGIGLTFLYEAG